MAAPAFRSASNDTGSGTGFTASEPAGAASGDGILMMILVEDTHGSFTVSGDFTLVPNCAVDVGPFSARVFYHRRGSSAPDYAVSWTTSRYYEYSVYAYSGVVSSGSFIDASASGTPTTGSEPNPPAITTTTADTRVCALAWTWAGWGGGGANPPSGYALRFGASSYDHGLADIEQAAAGSVDPGNFTNAGSDSIVGMTIALASVASGGGGGGGEPVVDQHVSVASFPCLCRKPKRDDGRWIRSEGGIFVPSRRAA
jgi:hypothetical protein